MVVADPSLSRLQLSLRNGSTYEAGKETADYHITAFPAGDQALQASKPPEVRASRPTIEMDTLPLYRQAYHDDTLSPTNRLDARIELQERLALPLACVLMALVGVPLGITRRRAGKSAAVVLTVALAFLYYMALISFISLARQGTLTPETAVWLPNLLFAIGGIIMVARLERPGDIDLIGALGARLGRFRQPMRGTARTAGAESLAKPHFAVAAGYRYLRSFELPVLLRPAAGQLIIIILIIIIIIIIIIIYNNI